MVILEKGDNWTLKNRCSNLDCYAKLEIDKEDIYVKIKEEETGFNYYYTFMCPSCNIETSIQDDLIPKYIKISALEQLKKRLGATKIEH